MNKFLLKIITVMTVLTSTISTVVYADEEQTSDDSSTVRILFTHDLHDHIDSYRVTNTETGEPEVIGGYAQLAGTIAANRNDHTIWLMRVISQWVLSIMPYLKRVHLIYHY